MKSYNEIAKKYKPEEIAASFVFPPDQTADERKESLQSFREWRRNNESNRSIQSRLITKLLQLRFVMEDYVKDNDYNQHYDFSYFLKEYINILDIKNKEFADQIDLDPTELSQIINKHRTPNEKIIIRLEIHSNKNFPAIIWFKLIEKEKTFYLLNNTQIRMSESKHVKPKLDFTF